VQNKQKKKINKSRPKSIFLYKKKINLSTQKKMAFSERMVLKKATNMSLHERFSQMRHEKITQPAAAPAPKYSAPPVRSAPPMPRSPPLPPRISDYYDDENDSDDVQITSFRNSSAQYHGLFSDKIRRRSNHQTSHSLAFQAAMQIKKKTFQNFNRIPVKQRLGLNRSQNFRPWYRRNNNWSSARGGRNFRGRNWGGNWGGGGRSRSRSQSFSNIDRPLTNNFRRSRSLPRWSRNGRGGFRGNRRGRGGFRQTQISKETLDAELDSYMADTKTVLDQELDDYMAQGVAHTL